MASSAEDVRFVRAPSGARIAWSSTGRGPTVVRAAHWMTNVGTDARSPIWRPWLDGVSRTMRVVRYDARGFGLSDADDAPFGVDASVEDLAAVVDATGDARVVLLGLSAGASTAIAYAARHPERVACLAIHGGYARGTLRRSPTDQQARLFEAGAQLIELGWGQRNPAALQLFTTRMIPGATPEQAKALNEQQRTSCPAARAAAFFRACGTIDVSDALARVRCPTLVTHCAGDAMVPIEEGRAVAAGVVDARFVALDSDNHLPLAGEPAFAQFCDVLAAFVRDATARAPLPGGGTLTPRERELLECVARGLDNLQIAANLGVAEKTVRNALSGLYAKLGVEGRPQAIVAAREAGFGAGR